MAVIYILYWQKLYILYPPILVTYRTWIEMLYVALIYRLANTKALVVLSMILKPDYETNSLFKDTAWS